MTQVLVVDDDADLREAMCLLLAAAGYQDVEAPTGAQPSCSCTDPHRG
jgi:CheY-like chemotaxis protein